MPYLGHQIRQILALLGNYQGENRRGKNIVKSHQPQILLLEHSIQVAHILLDWSAENIFFVCLNQVKFASSCTKHASFLQHAPNMQVQAPNMIMGTDAVPTVARKSRAEWKFKKQSTQYK